jgi:hypothetical protein
MTNDEWIEMCDKTLKRMSERRVGIINHDRIKIMKLRSYYVRRKRSEMEAV